LLALGKSLLSLFGSQFGHDIMFIAVIGLVVLTRWSGLFNMLGHQHICASRCCRVAAAAAPRLRPRSR